MQVSCLDTLAGNTLKRRRTKSNAMTQSHGITFLNTISHVTVFQNVPEKISDILVRKSFLIL